MALATPDETRGTDPRPVGASEGVVLSGRYRVGGPLGEGGMGVVVAAQDLREGRPVALKFLRGDVDATAVDRFLREASAASFLRTEHVTHVLEVGRLDSGLPFIVMEYLEGKTIAEIVLAGEPPSVAQAVDWALQACEGLAEAHGRGIIHRDLKPTNLFLTKGSDGAPLVKLLDFGISKFMSDGDAGLTTTGTVVGSPSFAAPEQLLDPRSVGPAVDLWALGVTLYWLLGRELPFNGESRMQVCMLVLNSTPVPLHELRPDLPRPLADAVMRCLEKEPLARPEDVGALAASLAPFAPRGDVAASRIAAILERGGTVAMPRPVPPADAGGAPAPVPPPPTSSARPRALVGREASRRSPVHPGAALAVGGMLFALGIVALVVGRSSSKAESDPKPSPIAVAPPVEPSAPSESVDVPGPGTDSVRAAASSAATGSGPARMHRLPPREPRRDPRSYR
jgi:serine/threonine-protein kinase